MTQQAARAFLLAIAKGETPDALLDEMVAGVLDATAVKLALEVRAGGPHQWRRAIELAGLLAKQQRPPRNDEGATNARRSSEGSRTAGRPNHRR